MKENLKYSLDGEERLYRSHGQSVREIYQLRQGLLPSRIPDVVVWPGKFFNYLNFIP